MDAWHKAAAAVPGVPLYRRRLRKGVVLTTLPEHEDAWRAQFLIAKSYKRRMEDPAADATEMQSAMRQALEQLLQRYPTCPAARGALRSLQVSSNSGSEGGHK